MFICQAAIKYCLKCTLIGPNWFQFNEMTERNEYLHIRKTRAEVFKQHWARTKKWHMQQLGDAVAASGSDAVADGAQDRSS